MVHRADDGFQHAFQIRKLAGRDAFDHRGERLEHRQLLLFLLFAEQDVIGGQAESRRNAAQCRHGHALDAEFDVGTEICFSREQDIYNAVKAIPHNFRKAPLLSLCGVALMHITFFSLRDGSQGGKTPAGGEIYYGNFKKKSALQPCRQKS